MKTFTFFLCILSGFIGLQAQDYQISFTGSGIHNYVDSIHVKNQTQGTAITLGGGDVLNLLMPVGINPTTSGNFPLVVYPNPMDESAFIDFFHPTEENIDISIINEFGVKIAEQHISIHAGRQKIEILGLNKGIYAIIVGASDRNYSAKIISVGKAQAKTNIEYRGIIAGSAPVNDLKSKKDMIQMDYNEGETLLLRGIADNEARVLVILPTESQVLDFEFIPCADIVGNHYAVVTIDDKTWMAENLKTTQYNNGIAIPMETNDLTWAGLTTPAYCWYNNNESAFAETYGALYNWYAVSTGNLCPEGWHVPDKEEFLALIDYLDGKNPSGGKMKSTGTIEAGTGIWKEPNYQASNESGFTAHPGGWRRFNTGIFNQFSETALFWSAKEMYGYSAWYLMLGYSSVNGTMTHGENVRGHSIRCLRD